MSPDDFRRLVSAGLSTDQIAVVMEMMAAKEAAHAEVEEARKAKGRERVAKWRADRNVTETSPNVTEPLMRDRVAPVSDKPITTDITNPKNNDHAEFKAELASLNPDRLEGLIKIRKAKKAPLTGYAARLYLKALAVCGLSLDEGADMCIERNWVTVKPEWLAKPAARGSPPPKQFAQNFGDFTNYVETRNAPEPRDDFEGPQRSIQHLSIVSTG